MKTENNTKTDNRYIDIELGLSWELVDALAAAADQMRDELDRLRALHSRNCDKYKTAADALAAYTEEKDCDLTLSPEAQDVIWWLFDPQNKEDNK